MRARTRLGTAPDIRLVTLYPLAFGCILVVFVKFALLGNDRTALQRFSIITLTLLVEALPFLLLGTFLSSILHVYVSEDLIRRLIPRSPLVAVLGASVMGLVLPVCDCGTVPLVRRLLAKGAPLHVGVTFLLAVPMINPVVLLSTWLAFAQKPQMVLYRVGFGAATAILVGLLMSTLEAKYEVRPQAGDAASDAHRETTESHARRGFGEVLRHAGDDFFDMGRYFLAGVLLSASVQTILPAQSLSVIGHDPVLSVPLMIAAAYVLSVCSQADAFIAQSFLAQFTPGAILAFLLFGPMIDMKNTLMLVPVFRRRLILLLIGMTAGCSLAAGLWLNLQVPPP